MEQETFLNISEASRMLGVSEASLRQWTDEGKIKAFITPGGHRRYSRADLKKFVSSHPRMIGIKDLVSELEETIELHREIARKSLVSASWYNKLSQESRKHLADQGRRFLKIIINYITEPSKREENSRFARQMGHEMGESLAIFGLPLTDSVEAFLMHRDLITNAATHLMKKKEAFSGRVMGAIPLVSNVMDEALVSLVAAHQQHRDGLQSELKGDPAG